MQLGASTQQTSNYPFEALPRRIFLDSCTAQTLRDYDYYIYEGEPVPPSDRLRTIPEGMENLDALRRIFLLNERALFEWIVSGASMQEAHDKRDPGHLQWLWDIADHSGVCLDDDAATTESETLAACLSESQFGYLSKKDRVLLQHAIALRCQGFLTMERRLPRNADHIREQLGLLVLTPRMHWKMLRPWAALWL
jgi:hypothetical protein